MSNSSSARWRCLLTVIRQGSATLSAVAISGFAAPAFAADFGRSYTSPIESRRPIDQSRRTSERLPLYRPQIWEGLYFGGNLGADFGSSGSASSTGFTGGLHVGYNWQVGSFVTGMEIDGSLKSADPARATSGAFTADGQQDWLTSMRLRLGYAAGGTLFYLTGGYAVGNLDVGLTGPGYSARINETISGYALGGGIEMKFAPNVSGRLEAIHYGFGEKDFRFSAGTVRADAEFTTVRAGLTWHFN